MDEGKKKRIAEFRFGVIADMEGDVVSYRDPDDSSAKTESGSQRAF